MLERGWCLQMSLKYSPVQSVQWRPVLAAVMFPLHSPPSAFIHRWSSCQKGISTADFPVSYFWPIQLFIPLLWISVVGVGIWKEISGGWWPKSLTRNEHFWQAWLLITWTDHQGENEESQGSAYLKHLWVPSHRTWSASSEQASMKQAHGLESHQGLSAKASSTQASLASLPYQVPNLWQTAEAWTGPIEKITARARPLHFMETRMCATAQPIP